MKNKSLGLLMVMLPLALSSCTMMRLDVDEKPTKNPDVEITPDVVEPDGSHPDSGDTTPDNPGTDDKPSGPTFTNLTFEEAIPIAEGILAKLDSEEYVNPKEYSLRFDSKTPDLKGNTNTSLINAAFNFERKQYQVDTLVKQNDAVTKDELKHVYKLDNELTLINALDNSKTKTYTKTTYQDEASLNKGFDEQAIIKDNDIKSYTKLALNFIIGSKVTAQYINNVNITSENPNSISAQFNVVSGLSLIEIKVVVKDLYLYQGLSGTKPVVNGIVVPKYLNYIDIYANYDPINFVPPNLSEYTLNNPEPDSTVN